MNIDTQRNFRCMALAMIVVAVGVLTTASAGAAIIPANAQTLNTGQVVVLASILEQTDPDAGLIIGDKLFTDFIYSHTNDMPTPNNVNVVALQDSNGNFGIRFQGSFGDLPDFGGPGDQVASDAGISFTVQVLDPLMMISGVKLAAPVFVDPANPGSFGSVDESFFNNNPIITETLQTFNSTFGAGGSQAEDSTSLPAGYQTLKVQKDIFARASHLAVQPVRMTIIDQYFEQIPIPEPTSAALMLMGGMAMVIRRRR